MSYTGYQKSEFCLKQGRKISDICLKQGQGMRGHAAPSHPGIYQVPPRLLSGFASTKNALSSLNVSIINSLVDVVAVAV